MTRSGHLLARKHAPGGSATATATVVIRGQLLWLAADPFFASVADTVLFEKDGAVVCRGGKIEQIGDYAAVAPSLPPDTVIHDYSGHLITPGFIDLHSHYVQTAVMGAYGKQLLDWLNEYTFVEEQRHQDPAHAAIAAQFFCDELLRNGTTTAMVFGAVYPHSADALFEAADRQGMRMIAGKVMMDRHAPPALLDTPQSAYDDSKALIERWHGRGRLEYAITPRFAPTSSPEQLEAAGALWREYPKTYVQTHLSENQAEIDWVRDLFPDSRDYLDVYDRYGLVGPGAVFAHGIHLSENELARFHETGAAIAHCPTSNLFLGSGLFDLGTAKHGSRSVPVGLGSDVGAGTSFSMLQTAGEAYKVGQLSGQGPTAAQLLYLMTLGAATALGLQDRLGKLAPGYEADLVVLDPLATPLLAFRTARSESILEILFALMTIGDDRTVKATYVAGRRAHERQNANTVESAGAA